MSLEILIASAIAMGALVAAAKAAASAKKIPVKVEKKSEVRRK